MEVCILTFSYKIINNSNIKNEEEIKILNQCFLMWSSYFGEDLLSRGEILNQSEFHRARYFGILMCHGVIAGFHLYCLFDLREDFSKNHSYFKPLQSLCDKIKQQGNSVFTMEYLTVAEGYRKNASGLDVAELVVRLGLKLARDLGCDLALGVARQDRKVDELGIKIGFDSLGVITKYENRCSVMLFPTNRKETSGDDILNYRVDALWNGRSGFNKTQKKSA